MLMLGNQKVESGYTSPFPPYLTFDPDGGDMQGDLSDLNEYPKFKSVVNIGTIEHVWDIHSAYCNVCRMIEIGGVYAGVGPCGGYNNHGIHTTRHKYILEFFERNGFSIVDEWLTGRVDPVSAPLPRGDTLSWIIALKGRDVDTFEKPQQIFRNGQKIH